MEDYLGVLSMHTPSHETTKGREGTVLVQVGVEVFLLFTLMGSRIPNEQITTSLLLVQTFLLSLRVLNRWVESSGGKDLKFKLDFVIALDDSFSFLAFKAS